MNNGWKQMLAVTVVGVAAAAVSGCASNEQAWISFDCEGNPVRVAMSADSAQIESALFSGTLPRVDSGSGVKYAADDKLFWTHAAHDGLAEFDGKRRLCLTEGDGIYSYSLLWQ